MDIENSGSVGNLRISNEVIATVAKLATLEIDGVHSVSVGNSGVKGLFTRANYAKPIKITVKNDSAEVDVSIIVKESVKIPELSLAVQKSVKDAVENMTGLTVSKVDVGVAGVVSSTENSKEN